MYPYCSTFRTVFSNEFKIKTDTEYMEKYCRFLLGARSFKKQWMEHCKKIRTLSSQKKFRTLSPPKIFWTLSSPIKIRTLSFPKIHNTPRPNNNQKSTLVMTENTPPIVAGLAKTRLVKTTDHKYAR